MTPAGRVRRVGRAVAAAQVARGRRLLPGPERSRPEFRIVSPREGDVYRLSPGVEPRYATVALRAAGGRGGAVRWIVDGVPHGAGRWSLQSGAHRFRAVSAAGDVDEVSVRVE